MVKSTSFEAHKKFRTEITRTRALFEASIHSFQDLYLEGKKHLKRDKPGSAELRVGKETVKVPWKTLTFHARDLYPRELRFVLLTRLVTIYEVFLVSLTEEITLRDKKWLLDDGRVEMSNAQLLSQYWNRSIESNVIEKHIRALTNGGLEDKRKFFQKKFSADIIPPGFSYKDIERVHDIRNIFVHRAGFPDKIFRKKYGLTRAEAKHRLHVSDQDLLDAVTVLEASAWHLGKALEQRFPQEIRPSYSHGTAALEFEGKQVQLIRLACPDKETLESIAFMTLPIGEVAVWRDYVVWQGVEEENVTALLATDSASMMAVFKTLHKLEMAEKLSKLESVKVSRQPKKRGVVRGSEATSAH